MTYLPLPQPFSDHLGLSSRANRSLVFDRGMDRYEPGRDFGIPAGQKEAFLKEFSQKYRPEKSPDFEAFVERRGAAMKALGAKSVDLRTHSRLVIGLGLPHPTETGLLLDRLTGSVYLPGSSVKGVLRAAAQGAARGELDAGDGFWTEEMIERVFGPPIEPGSMPKTGSLRVFDAIPLRWPRLEVDILTPHFTRHYEKQAVPADWESPTPVAFLTMAEDQEIRFFFATRDQDRWKEDWEQIEKLLTEALEWLGIGGKTSSGYGQLKQGALPGRPVPLPVEPEEPARPVLSVLLSLHNGTPTAFRGRKPVATCRPEELDPELLKLLKRQRGGVRAEVEVLRVGNISRIAGVRSWEEPS